MKLTEQQIQSLKNRVASNSRSPLFARLADYYLDIGKGKEGLVLCDKGLAHHPHYATGHLVKGRILASFGMLNEAEREFSLVGEIFPHNQVVKELLEGISGFSRLDMVSAQAAETEEPFIPVTNLKKNDARTTSSIPEANVREIMNAIETISDTKDTQSLSELPVSVTEDFGGMTAPKQVETGVEDETGLATDTKIPEQFELPAGFDSPEAVSTVSDENPFTLPEDFFAGISVAAETDQSMISEPEKGASFSDDPFSSLFANVPLDTSDIASPPAAIIETIDETPSQVEAETFEEFSHRIKLELGEVENSLTLEQFLAGDRNRSETPTQSSSDSYIESKTEAVFPEFPLSHEDTQPSLPVSSIEELAERLQNVKRVAPIINLQNGTLQQWQENAEANPSPPSLSAGAPAEKTAEDEEETVGFVTPTLAEIYAKQGWYDDALKAFRTLMKTRPAEKEKFQQRIEEIQKLKN